MVNWDGPTEQNSCLKCAYVSSAESYFALPICMLSHQRSAAVFYARRSHAPARRDTAGAKFNLPDLVYFSTRSISVLISP